VYFFPPAITTDGSILNELMHVWLCNLFYCFGKSPCASMPFAAANQNSEIGFQFREERIYRSE
jgi:hypothetical protein